MLAIVRREKILAILQAEKKVVVSDLSKSFQVSEETIRRDLEKLDQEGLAQKTYGGAVLKDDSNVDIPYTMRKNANVDKKLMIAELAAELIQDGDYIMLDASSTAIFLIKQMKHKKNITLITNSLEGILEASEIPDWKIFCTGGTLKVGDLSLVGYQAEQMIAGFHVDFAMVSSKGLDLEKGFTDANEMEAHIKKCMLKSAKNRICIADSTKFSQISFVNSFGFKDIDILITDKKPVPEWESKLQEEGISCVYPKEKTKA